MQTLPKIKDKISSEKYFDIVEKLRTYLQSDESPFKDFKELSFEAWRHSEEVNRKRRAQKEDAQKEREAVVVSDGDTTIYGTAVTNEDVDGVHYWIYSPGRDSAYWDEFYEAGIMGIGWDEIGDLRAFNSKEQIRQRLQEIFDPTSSHVNSAHATWQFANVMKPGDVVFVKKGLFQLVGCGIVESDYEYDSNREYYRNIRKVRWTSRGEWPHPGQAVVKTLTDITPYTDYVKKLIALIENDTTDDIEEQKIEYYSVDNFLEEVYMDEKSYEALVALVRNKKNIILQGAPGVGKTFVAKRLAYSMMGVKDDSRIAMIQFHQSYAYEDFIMGIRPIENRFEPYPGVFYTFCKKAEKDIENDYFFIIDEINRGNMSKIFGELLMLVESDKRGFKLKPLYVDEEFYVPSNVYIIGTMNTADRSLAMLDYALRRRFAFFELKPAFKSDGFQEYRSQLDSDRLNKLINCVENLNVDITEDESLGEGFLIGHSYFCDLEKEEIDQAPFRIVEFELIPLLKEYWFDEPDKVRQWEIKLREAVQ